MIGTLLRKVTRRPRPPKPLSNLEVTVFTRASCGCCEKALDVLRPFEARYGFRVELVDVDSDPALAEAHGRFVPVVTIDGKVRFRGKVNPVLLERLLQAQALESR